MLAYLLIHTAAGPVGLLINLVVYVIIAVILFLVLKWAAAEFGVPPRIVQLVGLLLFLLLILTLFVGCATDTGDAAKDRRGRITNAVGSEIFTAVLNAAIAQGGNALAGRNGQDAAAVLFQSAGQINFGGAITHVMAAAAGPQVAPIARVAAQQFDKAAPQTAAEKAFVVNTIGAAIQLAANQNAK